jgi:hypothetical protein
VQAIRPYKSGKVRLARALPGVAALVVAGCSRTDLSLRQIGDSPGAAGGSPATMHPPIGKPPADASAGMTLPEASVVPTPTTGRSRAARLLDSD